MRQVNYKLNPATINNAKPREKSCALTNGGGFLLELLPSGNRTWRFMYHLNGKREKRRLSFRTFARRWVDETLFYQSSGYIAQTVRWLDAYVYPAIGDMQLAEVQPSDVLAIIKARADTTVTAECIRVIVQQI